MSVSSVSSYSSDGSNRSKFNKNYREEDSVSHVSSREDRREDRRENRSENRSEDRHENRQEDRRDEKCETRCVIKPRHERVCEEPCPPPLCLKETKLKLCCGQRFYLERKPANPIFIAPGVVIEDYTLYLSFDVKDDSLLVLKKGCKVRGRWYNVNRKIFFVTESIRIGHREYPFVGSSDILNRNDFFNGCEVGYAPYFHQINNNYSPEYSRRTVNFQCQGKTLMDGHLDTIYQFYPTKQIRCTLDEDFFLTIVSYD